LRSLQKVCFSILPQTTPRAFEFAARFLRRKAVASAKKSRRKLELAKWNWQNMRYYDRGSIRNIGEMSR
jgi:hypothetical protein